MTHLDRRTLLGTLALAGAAATSVQAQPGMKALSDLKKEAEVACVYHCDYGDAARFAQTDHLHAPLVPRIARQRSHVGCFHHSQVMAHRKSSS